MPKPHYNDSEKGHEYKYTMTNKGENFMVSLRCQWKTDGGLVTDLAK